MVRCPNGHVFDITVSEVCPTCGLPLAHAERGGPAPVRAPNCGPVPVPPRTRLKPMLIGGGVLLALVVAVVVWRGLPMLKPNRNGETARHLGVFKPLAAPAQPERSTPKSAEIQPEGEHKVPSHGTGALEPADYAKTAPEKSATVEPDKNEKSSSLPSNKVEPPKSEKSNGLPAGEVQRWQTVLNIGGHTYICVNMTQPDGRYRLGDGCPPPLAGETGHTTVNADGTWSIRSDSGRVDHGTIETINPDEFIAHSATGASVLWTRVKANP
jgi:hypothetical protein